MFAIKCLQPTHLLKQKSTGKYTNIPCEHLLSFDLEKCVCFFLKRQIKNFPFQKKDQKPNNLLINFFFRF